MKIYTKVDDATEKKISSISNYGRFKDSVDIARKHFIDSGYNRRNDRYFEIGFMGFSWVNLENIEKWYQNGYDEELIQMVEEGNIDSLKDFVENGKDGLCSGGSSAKNYLKDLRFDSDMVATSIYFDVSGWSLLNVAAKGQPEMVDFLVQEVGMDVNTICYGCSPVYCCLPSMHDSSNNFSESRLNAMVRFVENGANLSHQIDLAPLSSGAKPSLMAPIHRTVTIDNDILRSRALDFITTSMLQQGQDVNIATRNGDTTLDHLLGYQGVTDIESVRILTRAGATCSEESNREKLRSMGLERIDSEIRPVEVFNPSAESKVSKESGASK